jgi:hypothetical protein
MKKVFIAIVATAAVLLGAAMVLSLSNAPSPENTGRAAQGTSPDEKAEHDFYLSQCRSVARLQGGVSEYSAFRSLPIPPEREWEHDNLEECHRTGI